jgi:hypothetical protein
MPRRKKAKRGRPAEPEGDSSREYYLGKSLWGEIYPPAGTYGTVGDYISENLDIVTDCLEVMESALDPKHFDPSVWQAEGTMPPFFVYFACAHAAFAYHWIRNMLSVAEAEDFKARVEDFLIRCEAWVWVAHQKDWDTRWDEDWLRKPENSDVRHPLIDTRYCAKALRRYLDQLIAIIKAKTKRSRDLQSEAPESREKPYIKGRKGYIPLSKAHRRYCTSGLAPGLPRLSQLCKPDGGFDYQRSGRRCDVYEQQFETWATDRGYTQEAIERAEVLLDAHKNSHAGLMDRLHREHDMSWSEDSRDTRE